MGKRQRAWARRERARLVASLGAICQGCQAETDLEFDCITPMGHAHHKFDSSRRLSFYHGQARAGNLQILCRFCNSIKAGHSQEQWFSALVMMRADEFNLDHSRTTCQGTDWTPEHRRQHLTSYLNGLPEIEQPDPDCYSGPPWNEPS